jgi:DMSO/TMAO reductase YedYZ molybdopterin-dependent catalytic subunit
MNKGLRNEDVFFEDGRDELLAMLEEKQGLSRRQLLKLGAVGAFSLPLLGALARGASARGVATAALFDNGSPISKPLPSEWFRLLGTNAEMRWDAVKNLGYSIPNERFFVRNHTGTPIIDASTWRLKLFGSGLRGSPDVDRSVEFTYDQLRAMPRKTVTCFIECAGNGRSFFASQQGTTAAGTQWNFGGIGVASWTGVPLKEVLRRAGILPSAVDVMPAGLDQDVVSNGANQGKVRRPLPVDKANDDVLLAYLMNGKQLPFDHGFPVRVVVPGWVGIASVKWVGQIEVADHTLTSFWNTTQYRFTGPSYPADSPPLTTQVVKSAFELELNANLPAGKPVMLTGRSWSPFAKIKNVEISTDGGTSWKPAQLYGANIAKAWARWRFTWTPASAGSYSLMARATDTAGHTQPATVPFNDGGYLFGAIVKHPVAVT